MTNTKISGRRSQIALTALLLPLLTACHGIRVSEPTRTATEQLLLSTATDEAVQDIDLSPLKDRKIFFDDTYFESYDDGYAKGSIRELIATAGGKLVSKRDKSEVVVEARSGALGIDSRESLLGLPELNLPIPLAGQVQSPELVLYKSQKSDSVAKFALIAYETESGDLQVRTGSMVGKSKFYHYKILGFINWRSTDIPEQKPKR